MLRAVHLWVSDKYHACSVTALKEAVDRMDIDPTRIDLSEVLHTTQLSVGFEALHRENCRVYVHFDHNDSTEITQEYFKWLGKSTPDTQEAFNRYIYSIIDI